ncbi:MAG: ATP phosphoribosyltransferase regulatory subunit [Bacilli bacterium]|nr:ATP phosphoribosyltransferase regulatory subunit [Bacilli bacterium]
MTLDIIGSDAKNFLYIENLFKNLMEKYNYQYIKTPNIEDEQILSLIKSDDYLDYKLSPDLVVGVIRNYLSGKFEGQSLPLKVWYSGSAFEENNYSETYYLGINTLGSASPTVDTEVINATINFCRLLGLNNFSLKINTNGDVDHFDKVKKYLEELEIDYEVDESLTLLQNYYTDTIFSVVTNISELDDQLIIGSGGRYNNLIKEIGGIDTPGFDLKININNLLTILNYDGFIMNEDEGLDVYVGITDEDFIPYSLKLVEALRMNAFNVEFNHNNIKMDKINDSKFIIIVDEKTINDKILTIINNKTKEKFETPEEYIINLLDEKVSGVDEENLY